MQKAQQVLERHTLKEKKGLHAEACNPLILYYSNSGSPTWTRTRDLRINSPSLYQLSYQGKEAALYTANFQLSRLEGENQTIRSRP